MNKSPIVLVVEDEPLLLLMAGTMVEDAGLQPLYAGNADEAVAILEARTISASSSPSRHARFDGRLQARGGVRGRWPPITIIVVSGHANVAMSELPDGARFFGKPYDEQRVVETLMAMAA